VVVAVDQIKHQQQQMELEETVVEEPQPHLRVEQEQLTLEVVEVEEVSQEMLPLE
tara:strand:+ start:461 stop:625 length:165 start_codon:yes stop_codon:yes gene_type:complete